MQVSPNEFHNGLQEVIEDCTDFALAVPILTNITYTQVGQFASENLASQCSGGPTKKSLFAACQHWAMEHIRQKTGRPELPLTLLRFNHASDDCRHLLSRRIQKVEVKVENGIYEYRPSSRGTLDWYVDFANKKLGGGFMGNGLVQEEIMTLEFFDMAYIASRRDATVQQLNPDEAYLVTGLQRYCAIRNVYGHSQLDRLSPEEVVRQVEVLHTPVHANLIAIDAVDMSKRKGSKYSPADLLLHLNKAYAGFGAAALTSRSVNRECVVHTGHWGCGAFSNHPVVMYVLQYLACVLSDVKTMVYYLPSGGKGDAQRGMVMNEGRAIIDDALSQNLSIIEIFAHLLGRMYGPQ